MFDPKLEVPSLELCKKLRELGFPQGGGGWYWIKENGKWKVKFFKKDELKVCPHFIPPSNPNENKGTCEVNNGECAWKWDGDFWDCEYLQFIKAPTCRELGEWLPEGFNEFKRDNKFWVKDKRDYHYLTNDDTEPNARAKMVIWLKENGYITFKKEET